MKVEEANYDLHKLSLERDEASPYYLHKFFVLCRNIKKY
jgi:hypothetical protein